ncbi:MAG: phosphatidate cytidylyltransferase [Pseudomonadota bacterium]
MSDLGTRLISALAMIALAAGALWLGGWYWIALVVLVAGLVLWEWNRLVSHFNTSPISEVIWLFVGACYITAAALAMIQVRINYGPVEVALIFLLPIIAVDVGAYFAGRTFGGPKIAPKISPSKTWAGLAGGALAASAVAMAVTYWQFGSASSDFIGEFDPLNALAAGVLIAVIAQAGDFFESWMKRRAGVKDSGGLIPGHGGVFDRVDGFIAVFFVLFVVDAWPKVL